MKYMIIDFIAFIITAPVVVSAGMYYFLFRIYGKKQKALHKMVNTTTVLYIIAVNTLIFIIFGHVFYSWTVVFLLLVFSFIVFIQWKVATAVEIGRAFKLLWRFSFLLFFFLYLCLILIGLLQQILYR